jgi:hypothetical protein
MLLSAGVHSASKLIGQLVVEKIGYIGYMPDQIIEFFLDESEGRSLRYHKNYVLVSRESTA